MTSEDQVRQMAVDLNGWPDAAHLGVPLNSERDGWHWVRTSLHNELTTKRGEGQVPFPSRNTGCTPEIYPLAADHRIAVRSGDHLDRNP